MVESPRHVRESRDASPEELQAFDEEALDELRRKASFLRFTVLAHEERHVDVLRRERFAQRITRGFLRRGAIEHVEVGEHFVEGPASKNRLLH
jgi:hypothetical protein